MSRLVREISLMELLNHESIVKLHETFESCDSLFLVMEYVPGWNLDEYLQKKEGGALNEEEARHLFRQLVSAVDYCHHRWIVHRDLKTPNILVTPEGNLKLADFGLGNRFGLQRLGTICGSMLYYSPEIITGKKYHGPEVDCWCLGITLFRMTAGFEPFSHAHTVSELKKDVCSCNFPMPSTLSPELQATIRKCLQIERRKRMSLRQALKDDPWLTKSGELTCPVSVYPKTMYDEQNGVLDSDKEDTNTKARSQLSKDMERDVQSVTKVRKTVIYHPINPSTYYTTKAGSGSFQSKVSSSNHVQNVELLRSELLQSIRSRARRLGIRSAERWDTLKSSGLKSLFPSFHSKKKKESSGKTLSGIVQRMARDQVYHFQLVHSHCSSGPPSLCSSGSTDSLSSSVDPVDSAVATIQDDEMMSYEKKNAREVMALLKQTCQLMGITYFQDAPTSLQCVLTLRSAPKTTSGSSGSHMSSSKTSGSISSSPPPPQKNNSSRKTSQTSGSYIPRRSESFTRSKRLSLPLLSHLTSSMTTSFFGKKPPRHSLDETTPTTAKLEKNKKKEGMAMFSIHVEYHKKKMDKVSLRFSRQEGSNTVFKMAGGWVVGVMALDGKIGR
ncbi:kinase-like protein [Backusella circina FSU 941]|nr:kinase-like protein [Backusella circina FSU 941]